MGEARITRLTVESENGRIDVEVCDEGAGEYVAVRDATNGGDVGIDPGEWPMVRDAIDRMMAAIK